MWGACNDSAGGQSTKTPLTAMGFPLTKPGVLKHDLKLPIYWNKTAIMEIVVRPEKRGWMEQRFKRLQILSTRSRRGRLESEKGYDEYEDAFDGVASIRKAITRFHLDSVVTGNYIDMSAGIKVVCSCPATDNWEVFQPYHLRPDPSVK
jgi:hypothetical protein